MQGFLGPKHARPLELAGSCDSTVSASRIRRLVMTDTGHKVSAI
jgi:hypothetical protein